MAQGLAQQSVPLRERPEIQALLPGDASAPMNRQSLNRHSGAGPERSRRVVNNPLRYTVPTGRHL